jgi:hypothetical protein
MLHEKIWVLSHAPCYKNVQVPQKKKKKKNPKMVDVYRLSVLISEKEEFFYQALLLL